MSSNPFFFFPRLSSFYTAQFGHQAPSNLLETGLQRKKLGFEENFTPTSPRQKERKKEKKEEEERQKTHVSHKKINWSKSDPRSPRFKYTTRKGRVRMYVLWE